MSMGRNQNLETRERIIQATKEVMQARGLAGATTREIARAAGCSEGTLYNYFESKEELFLCVLREQLPSFIALIMALPQRAGSGTVRENLEEVAHGALTFYHQAVPMGDSVFAEPKLLARLREEIRKRNVGPHKANEGVAAYLRAEQLLARVSGDASPRAIADLLLGACFQQAHHLHFLGEAMPDGAEERFVKDIMDILMDGLSPEAE
jgi:AcrR family transcriptional regulator